MPTSASADPEVGILSRCLERRDLIATTGLVIQELLQGFEGPRQAKRILEEFALLPVITPEVEDHVRAAELRNHCRRHGVQIGTIDALLARLAIRHGLHLLAADRDFDAMARHCPLVLLKD